jgi:hypothetical protein
MSVLNSVWYVDSVNAAAVGTWVVNTAKVVGNLIRATAPTIPNERTFMCVVAGTTHTTTEPTWPTSKGARIADATVTWQEVTGQAGVCGDLTNCPLSSAARSQTPALGLVIQNNAGTYLFICKTSGACGAGEPTYTLTAGVDTTDSSCTWTCLGAVGGFTALLCAASRITNVCIANWAVNGDTIYVGSDHAETQGLASVVIAPAGTAKATSIICADHLKSPPSATDFKTTATVTTTGGFNLSLQGGSVYVYGITLACATGAVANVLSINPTTADVVLDTCALQRNGTSVAANAIVIGSSGNSANIRLKNTTVQFGNTGDGIEINGGRFTWENTPSAIAGATIPTTLFQKNSSLGGDVILSGVDLSALGSGTLVGTAAGGVRYVIQNCLLGTSYVAAGALTPGTTIDIVASDSAASNLNYLFSRNMLEGSHTTAINPVRTNGATDGTTPVSWNINTTSSASWACPFTSQQIAIWNSVLSTNRVVSMYGIINAAAVPNNDDIWFDVNYLGTSTSPISSIASTTKANLITANGAYTADTSAWDSAATARANTTAYTVGNIIKVASNSGRVFFCTTSGTSAGSEPGGGGGYSSAVDGGSVTDGGAVFRAGCRFIMSVTLQSPLPQPLKVGYMRARIKAGKVSTLTWWIDPLIVLS